MKNTKKFINNLKNKYSAEIELLSSINFEFLEFDNLDEMVEHLENSLELAIDGVYVSWNDCYYRDRYDAIDVLKNDDYAVEQAFMGRIEFESKSYIGNRENGAILELESYDINSISDMIDFIKESI